MLQQLWGEWMEKYPETLVLSKETGHRRDYSAYPYGTYEEDEELYFKVGNSDARLHPKAVVYGVLIDDNAKAFVQDYLEDAVFENGTSNFQVGDTWISVTRGAADEYTFVNLATGEEIVPIRGFWFAWAAFYPDTELESLTPDL